MKILITGATGFIGQSLGLQLCKQGHELVVVSRDRVRAQMQLPFPCEVIEADLTESPLNPERLVDVEVVIHLMGESVASRWTGEHKARILKSRIESTRHLVESLKSVKKLKHFISTSAIGFYGDRGDEILSEDSSFGGGFLAEVCQKWESSAMQMSALRPDVYVSIVRIGIVLGSGGGALDAMQFPFRVGVGGNLSDGRQWMSWIHKEDLLKVFLHILKQERSMIYNAVAPFPVQNREFTKSLCQVLGRPQNLPLPKIALKIFFGEMSAMLLGSQKVDCRNLKLTNFSFRYQNLQDALDEIFANAKNGEDVFESYQYIPVPVENVFPFFAEAKNLEEITPPLLQFKIEKVSDESLREGSLIDYKLKIHYFPVKWKTLIKEWSPPYKFVDFQLKGPYRLWHHTHEFQSLGPGTLMIDRVRYQLPFGYLGWLVASQFVKSDIEKIFNYRRKIVQEKFAANKKLS